MPLITRRELARRHKVHVMTVTAWEREGMPIAERGGRGRSSMYDPAAVTAWRRARKAAAQGVAPDFLSSRARKELAQALEAEQRVSMRAGKLIPTEEVAKIWGAEVTAVRSLILSSYTTHADRIHRAAILDGLPGVERALKDLAHEILRELASPDRDVERAS